MQHLRISSKPTRDGIELMLDGELLFADAQEFMLSIPEKLKNRGANVVFNVERLKFIDSSGLGSILYVSQACGLQNQTVRISKAAPQIEKLLKRIHKVGTFEFVEKQQP
ncbi:MAG TPA: STAS domain-containing protein [bacterium]|nr:STAS domain-containing protein [bacterium]